MVGHLSATCSTSSRVIYFFCQFDNAESLSASTIISSLIRQCLDSKTLSEDLESRLSSLYKISCPELKEMGILLRDVLAITKASFVLIDGIDDCRISEQSVLLRVLQDLMAFCSSVVKVFLAVRQGLVEEVENICNVVYQATMNTPEAHLSMMTYIDNVLAEKKQFNDLVVGNPELLKEIRDVLVQEANGR